MILPKHDRIGISLELEVLRRDTVFSVPAWAEWV